MHHIIELIINFFMVWPGSRGPDSIESRTFTGGCLLMILILLGIIVGIFYIVS